VKVYVVVDTDECGNTFVSAVYQNEEMAQAHEEEMGGFVSAEEIRDVLHPDVTDSALVASRANEAAKYRRQWQEYREHQERNHELRMAVKPSGRMNLCSCATFSEDSYFINPHGYCSYCGGFTPEVFRAHLGEAALKAKIDELGIYYRIKMKAICGLSE
jgi:hypothetical protein